MGVFEPYRHEPSQRAACSRAHLGVLCSLAIGMMMLALPAIGREKAECGPTVTVGRGDTLSKIAQRCGTTIPALLKANPQIRNPNIVPLGSTLTTSTKAAAKAEEPDVETTGSIAIELSEAASGERMTLSASGLPPRSRVWIKGGEGSSPKYHLMLRSARTNAEGELRTTVRMPRLSKAAQARYRFSVEVPRKGITLLSPPLEDNPKKAAGKKR